MVCCAVFKFMRMRYLSLLMQYDFLICAFLPYDLWRFAV